MRAPLLSLCATVVLLASAAGAQPAPKPPPPAPTTTTPAPPATATPTAPPPPATAPPPAAGTAPPPPGTAPPPPPGAYPYPYPPYPYPPPPGYYPPGYYAPPAPPPPRELPYEEGKEPPPGYSLESRVRRGPLIAGIIMFSVTYGINLMVASVATGNDDQDTWLYIPGVGTWALVNEECDSSGDNEGCTFLIMHSVTHTLGLGLILYGVAAQKQVWVRDASVKIVPVTYAGGGGLGVLGEF